MEAVARRVAAPLVLALAALGCPIAGDGSIREETREVEAFEGLEVFDDFVVEVEVDAEAATATATVRADANLLRYVYTEGRSGTHLSLAFKPTQEVVPTAPPAVKVVTATLTSLYVEDASAVTIAGASGDLALKAAGEASAEVEGALAAAGAEAEGAGSLVLRGTAASLVAAQHGGGTIDGGALMVAGDAEVTIDGGGDVIVCASGEVRGEIARGRLVLACPPARIVVEVGVLGALEGPP